MNENGTLKPEAQTEDLIIDDFTKMLRELDQETTSKEFLKAN